LREEARHVLVGDQNINFICELALRKAFDFFENLELKGAKAKVAEKIIQEIKNRIFFLINVGLDYLSLSRTAETLSGGEAQRIRLASQIGSGLTGVMYVLDEPSIGLHQRDNAKLLKTLKNLRDLGNTVIVVEHDYDAIMAADYVVDIGPGAGLHGGQVIAEGTPQEVLSNENSLTGHYLSGKKVIELSKEKTKPNSDFFQILKASGNNLKDVDLKLPIGLMTCITGVSGSGKSTLINNTLYHSLAKHLYKSNLEISPHKEIKGFDFFDKVVDVNQSPIGRTPRSNPATYTGLFTPIRDIFSKVPESKLRGYAPGRFSFNVKGGRCESCEGDGVVKVEMHFLPDVYVKCDFCEGQRYNRETLEIKYKNKNIHDVLSMTVEQAYDFFSAIPVIERKLKTLLNVGLSYIKLGQNATTLSGGEAQRVKLALELSKRDTGRTLYILDEPTTGLHFADIQLLLNVLHQLKKNGNTLAIIEHNLDVIKTADWIIDLGPEGGDGGGQIIAEGTPSEICKNKKSYTGKFLKDYL
jgi:excinuclease ABC subunit A